MKASLKQFYPSLIVIWKLVIDSEKVQNNLFNMKRVKQIKK